MQVYVVTLLNPQVDGFVVDQEMNVDSDAAYQAILDRVNREDGPPYNGYDKETILADEYVWDERHYEI